MITKYKAFEKFVYDEEEEDYIEKWNIYTTNKINEILGDKYIGRSADWGGMSMWKLQGNLFIGYFIIIDDDNNIILLHRTFDEETENNIDEDIVYISEGGDISELLDKIIEIKILIDFNI